MQKFELEAKMDAMTKTLSGGMKRKLSMANSIVGGSSVSYRFRNNFDTIVALLETSPIARQARKTVQFFPVT